MLGAGPIKVEPVMTHQYIVHFASEEAMAAAHDRLAAMTLAGKPVCGFEQAPENVVQIRLPDRDIVEREEQLHGVWGRNNPVRFGDLFYPIKGMKSGRHHPEGVLWVRAGRHAVHSESVSILDIAPTVCDLLRLDPDAVRRAGFRGTSLLGRIAAA